MNTSTGHQFISAVDLDNYDPVSVFHFSPGKAAPPSRKRKADSFEEPVQVEAPSLQASHSQLFVQSHVVPTTQYPQHFSAAPSPAHSCAHLEDYHNSAQALSMQQFYELAHRK
ncbi:hypothetical protein BC830DRAFT_1167729 [Chytriomyces sp. MP71]|nr:hypothetical protein BC830DRAFT_1167729 [Chytriomyces sp. MP71]